MTCELSSVSFSFWWYTNLHMRCHYITLRIWTLTWVPSCFSMDSPRLTSLTACGSTAVLHYVTVARRSVQDVPEQITPASSLCRQLCLPQPWEWHCQRKDSFPLQWISSSKMGPVPSPKWAESVALMATPQPSCLHTTWASLRSQLSSQTVPQDPSW